MTARIINLRTRRKHKARDAKRKAGDANALKSGQPKSEKSRLETLARLERQRLDGHKREDDD
jgi:hypothetical protein